MPLIGLTYNQLHQHCNTLAQEAFQLAVRDPNIKNVVIAASWNTYLTAGHGLKSRIEIGDTAYQDALLKLSQYIKSLAEQKTGLFDIEHPRWTSI